MLNVLVGAAIALLGTALATAYQRRSAAAIAREIRADERQETALAQLLPMLKQVEWTAMDISMDRDEHSPRLGTGPNRKLDEGSVAEFRVAVDELREAWDTGGRLRVRDPQANMAIDKVVGAAATVSFRDGWPIERLGRVVGFVERAETLAEGVYMGLDSHAGDRWWQIRRRFKIWNWQRKHHHRPGERADRDL